MYRNSIPIQNLNCGTCATELKKNLLNIKNITNVIVHYNYSHVTFNHISAYDLSNIENELTHLGFPPVGEKS